MSDQILSEHLRQMAMEVAQASKEKNVKRALVGLTVEQVLQLATRMEEFENLTGQIEEAYDEAFWPEEETEVQ